MWNIRPDGVERQCILYKDGVEIDPAEEDAKDILLSFCAFVIQHLPENRSVYVENLPVCLEMVYDLVLATMDRTCVGILPNAIQISTEE